MAQKRYFQHDTNEPALVLFQPVADGGLWDSKASALIEAVEDELDVFVTWVGRGRGALGLHDAASAARFMGCDSMVVIAPVGVQPPVPDLEAASEQLRFPAVSIQTEWSPQAVSEAYRSACRLVPRAA